MLSQAPAVLTLHLKRFRSTGRRVHKLDEYVPFPTTLDLTPFICAAGPPATHYEQLGQAAAGSGHASSSMRLYGVVEHEGIRVKLAKVRASLQPTELAL